MVTESEQLIEQFNLMKAILQAAGGEVVINKDAYDAAHLKHFQMYREETSNGTLTGWRCVLEETKTSRAAQVTAKGERTKDE